MSAPIERTTDIDAVLDKLVKIQELIDRGATAGEIAAATGRMQAMLTKHNLTLELVAHHKGEDRTKPASFSIKITSAAWEDRLARGIARANYGKDISSGSGSYKTMRIVCHKEDWPVIQHLFAKFRELIERMAPIAYEQERAWFTSLGPITFEELPALGYEDYRRHRHMRSLSKRQWCTDWRLGCAEGISDALLTARREAERDTEGSSALVVIKEAAVQDAFTELFPAVTYSHAAHRSSAARTAGYATGGQLARGTSIRG